MIEADWSPNTVIIITSNLEHHLKSCTMIYLRCLFLCIITLIEIINTSQSNNVIKTPSIVERLRCEDRSLNIWMKVLRKHAFPKLVFMIFVTLLNRCANLLICDFNDVIQPCSVFIFTAVFVRYINEDS